MLCVDQTLDWREAAEKDKFADCVIIATPDREHKVSQENSDHHYDISDFVHNTAGAPGPSQFHTNAECYNWKQLKRYTPPKKKQQQTNKTGNKLISRSVSTLKQLHHVCTQHYWSAVSLTVLQKCLTLSLKAVKNKQTNKKLVISWSVEEYLC